MCSAACSASDSFGGSARLRARSNDFESITAAIGGEEFFADDVAGFHAAKGIVTSEGGKASHAALVARGMGKPCVSGASELEIDLSESPELESVGDDHVAACHLTKPAVTA